MTKLLLKSLVFALAAAVTLAVKGVDTQFTVTLDQMKCIKNNNNEGVPKQYFITLRAWNGNNTLMGNLKESLANAQKAGVNASQLMLYVQPCGGVDGKQQIQNLFNGLTADEQKLFSRVWINVETNPNNGCTLSKTQSDNCKLVNDLLSQIKAQGKLAGIYSSIFMWNHYVNSDCISNADDSLASWYPHDDKLPNFYDFNDFGVFGPFKTYTEKTLKTYKIDSSLCGISGNVNQLNMSLDQFNPITSKQGREAVQ